jgi:hypothetical protein
MRSSIPMLRPAVVAAALLFVAACGSDKTCSDACNNMFACTADIGQSLVGTDVNNCIDRCNAGSCTDKQGAINCMDGLACVAGGVASCLGSFGCVW